MIVATLRQVVFALALLALPFLLASCANGQAVMAEGNKGLPPGDGFMIKELTTSSGARKYAVFIPDHYTPTRKWPTIVFLHGLGEGGTDATANVGVGIGPFIAKHAHDFPFIVVFPQSPSGYWDEDSQQAADAMAALAQVKKEYAVDSDRVILTGLSTGGYGTWSIGAKYHTQFAALVPMCAFSPHEKDLPVLAKMPVWAFHNSGDMFVFSGNSSWAVKEINKMGGNAKLTEYGALGHNCWDEAYSQGELVNWMLQQRRSSGVASPGAAPGSQSRLTTPTPVVPGATPVNSPMTVY